MESPDRSIEKGIENLMINSDEENPYEDLDNTADTDPIYTNLTRPDADTIDEIKATTTPTICFYCEKSLIGQKYVIKDEKACCIPCFNDKFSNQCESCRKTILCDSKDLCFNEKHWHGECFKCSDCEKTLVDLPFASKDDIIFCPECYEEKFALRCDVCARVFKAGSKKFEYNNKKFHEECFVCVECNSKIGSGSFIPRDDGIICTKCFDQNHTPKCKACEKSISKGGITYKGTSYHKECFVCVECSCMLSGKKFTSKEEKPYCADCFATIFCKKCSNCDQRISGLEGMKYISYEDKQWHQDCFICTGCSISLSGKGFLPLDGKIFCGDCGQKIQNPTTSSS